MVIVEKRGRKIKIPFSTITQFQNLGWIISEKSKENKSEKNSEINSNDFSENPLEEMTLAELREYASSLGIENVEEMGKKRLRFNISKILNTESGE